MNKLLVLILLLPVIAVGQKKGSPQSYAKTITADDLKNHLYIVAGKDMQGRETATEGQRKAAAYIEEQFKSLGLLPGNNGSYQQTFPVYRDETTATRFVVNDKEYKLNDEFQPYALGSSNVAQYFSEVVFAGYGISDSAWDDYKGLNVIGKLVLIMDGMPANYKSAGNASARVKVVNAQKRGAAGLLIISGTFPRRQGRRAGSMYQDLYRPTQYLNTYYINESAAAAITGIDWNGIKSDAKNGKLEPKVYSANIQFEATKKVIKLESSNVLGVLEGSDLKDEYVFITAHYDHEGMIDTTIFYGADDDGSGTVSVLELAQAFTKAKAEGKGPRRTIVFMTVSGEEKGLWGSEYYVNHPVFPLDKTTVDLNIDMVGRVGTEYQKDNKDSLNYIYVIGDDKLSSDLTPITEQANNKNLKLKLDRKYNDPKDPNRFYYRSDHYNFAEKGVPIIFYFNGVHQDYHQPTDTPDKINYPLMAKRAQLVFYTAWEMANRDAMLKRDLKLGEDKKAF
jgi:hypothetical protein